jgi:hypothetical protein
MGSLRIEHRSKLDQLGIEIGSFECKNYNFRFESNALFLDQIVITSSHQFRV